MKLIKCISFFVLLSAQTLNAQSYEWTKQERNNIYENCMNELRNYKEMSQEINESLCLCYLNEITGKYRKRDFDTKIDVELKRIRQSNIIQCSKNLGIDLEDGSEEIIETQSADTDITKEAIEGKWTFEKGQFTFYSDGEYKYQSNAGTKCRGKWNLNNSDLNIASVWCGSQSFEVVKVTDDEIVMYKKKGRRLFHLNKV